MKASKAQARRLPKIPRLPKLIPRPGLPRLPRLPFPLFRLQRVNLPNQLTLLRIALIPVFISLFLSDSYKAQWLSLLVFLASAITDYYDGKIARERGLITNFGKVLDPLADKLLLLTAMISLVEAGVVPGWMVTVIWWRELAVTGLRTLVAARSRVLAADAWGKTKTVLQIVAVVVGMLSYVGENTLNARSVGWNWRLQAADWGGDPVAQAIDTFAFAYWLMFLSAIVSLVSGLRYFRKNWEIVCEELEEAERVEG